jgi:head-tail adaptor
MEPGKLNRRITYTPKETPVTDGAGGFTIADGTPVETWCSAEPLSQSESLLNGLKLGQAAYRFTFRYEQGTNITQAVTLTYESRSFRVIQILEINENKRIVKVLANERTN